MFTKKNNIMSKKIVGWVSADERDEINTLFERLNSLHELSLIVNSDDKELYDKMQNDQKITKEKFDQWWQKMAKMYNWEASEHGNWEINFETREIYLIIKD